MINIFQKVSRQRTAAVGLLLITSAMILPGCGPAETTTQQDAKENVTTEELSNGAEGQIGKTVSIRSEVTEAVGDSAFLLDDKQLFGGENVLVINASGKPFTLVDGDDTEVQVTGEVQQFVVADVDKQYGLNLDPTLYTDYENKPVVIAKSLALSPDPGDLTSNPDKYYNKRIAVEGEVGDKLSPTTFTIDEDQLFNGEDVLVLTQGATPQTQDGEKVTVTGVLRPYIKAEFDKDYTLDWDLSVQEKIDAEYSEKPVFVADEVYPSAM